MAKISAKEAAKKLYEKGIKNLPLDYRRELVRKVTWRHLHLFLDDEDSSIRRYVAFEIDAKYLVALKNDCCESIRSVVVERMRREDLLKHLNVFLADRSISVRSRLAYKLMNFGENINKTEQDALEALSMDASIDIRNTIACYLPGDHPLLATMMDDSNSSVRSNVARRIVGDENLLYMLEKENEDLDMCNSEVYNIIITRLDIKYLAKILNDDKKWRYLTDPIDVRRSLLLRIMDEDDNIENIRTAYEAFGDYGYIPGFMIKILNKARMKLGIEIEKSKEEIYAQQRNAITNELVKIIDESYSFIEDNSSLNTKDIAYTIYTIKETKEHSDFLNNYVEIGTEVSLLEGIPVGERTPFVRCTIWDAKRERMYKNVNWCPNIISSYQLEELITENIGKTFVIVSAMNKKPNANATTKVWKLWIARKNLEINENYPKMPYSSSFSLAPPNKCECGGEKANTTHAEWCPKY